MQVEQRRWMHGAGWMPSASATPDATVQLALVFGSTALLKDGARLAEIKQAYPKAQLFGCSTAGEICGTQVTNDSFVVTALRFTQTTFAGVQARLSDGQTSTQIGEQLGRALKPNGLRHVLVLSDGLKVNGSELVEGLTKQLPHGVAVTGGLSGDGERFQETLVLADGEPQKDTVAVLGLYGDRLRVGYGSLGGWDPFGPDRLITRSTGNVLYELDGTPALELYKRYLGEHAEGLPASGLLFPLSLRAVGEGPGIVRTILAVDEAKQSMTFAGDVPEGVYARLMKANFDRLVDGAQGAAMTTAQALGSSSSELAILISCVGRKLVLKQRVEEEVEAVRGVLGDHAALMGFYSYGEICPAAPQADCELHNQTMTITALSEG